MRVTQACALFFLLPFARHGRGSFRGAWIYGLAIFVFSSQSGCFLMPRKAPTTLAPGARATGSAEGQAPLPSERGSSQRARLQVSVGAGHSCALVADGKVYCWGDNSAGQLGDGSYRSRQRPSALRSSAQLVAISSGTSHACGIDREGQLWCWGDNRFGQLGLGSASLRTSSVNTPSRVAGGSGKFRAVVAGGQHTCAIDQNNQLWCWGDNRLGQLGQAAPTIFSQPTQVSGVGRVKHLALGNAHSCIQRSDQVVLCWGDNRQGQLGTPSPAQRHRPARVNGLGPVQMLAAGGDRSCAASNSGLLCWGRGSGAGAGYSAKRVARVSSPKQLSVGGASACVIDAQNRPYCWGRNDEGQLGDGGTRDSQQPRPVAGLNSALAMSVGPRHSCAVGSRGKVHCWGSDGYAALGANAPQQSGGAGRDPRPALMLQPARGLAAGQRFACALSEGGSVYCWGDNSKGQLGIGSHQAQSATPSMVKGIDDATQVVAAAEHACALRKNGEVKCWGSNLSGQLGIAQNSKVARTPVSMSKMRDVTQLAAGSGFSCALSRQGQVWCWGASDRGQLGHVSGGFGPVSGLTGVTRIFAGGEHACARDRSGLLSCWGDNRKGQLGSNGGARDLEQPMPRPVRVRGINQVGDVALGKGFSCAVSGNKRVYCWGENRHGQIGNGTASDVWMMPVPVSQLRQVSALGGGASHACAAQGGGIQCWGKLPVGPNGGGSDARKPVRVLNKRAQQLVGGEGFSCALEQEGDVLCWGQEQAGELGRGDRGFSTRALQVQAL